MKDFPLQQDVAPGFSPTCAALKGGATFRRQGKAYANAAGIRAVGQNFEFASQPIQKALIDSPSQGTVFSGMRKEQARVGDILKYFDLEVLQVQSRGRQEQSAFPPRRR